MQSGGVLSISHAPNSFILTGLLDHIVDGFMLDFSAIIIVEFVAVQCRKTITTIIRKESNMKSVDSGGWGLID